VDADDGHEAAALWAFFAIAEKKIGATSGAEIARKDVSCVEAGVEELGTVGPAKIEIDVFGGRNVMAACGQLALLQVGGSQLSAISPQ
jgi:hypothetical protein